MGSHAKHLFNTNIKLLNFHLLIMAEMLIDITSNSDLKICSVILMMTNHCSKLVRADTEQESREVRSAGKPNNFEIEIEMSKTLIC